MKPMSYSNATDLQTRLTYRDKSYGSPMKGPRGDGAYIETFDNKYYDAIKLKDTKIKEKQELVR